MMTPQEASAAAINKLLKWRIVLVGRLLGAKPIHDPQSQGVRDLVDKVLLLRVEVTALTGLCLRAGAFTLETWHRELAREAEALDVSFEQVFPGFKTTEQGVEINTAKAPDATKDWSR